MLQGFDTLIGLELAQSSPELMRGSVPVRDEIRQPFGLVHGGLYATVAETLASLGTALAVLPEGKQAMGMSNNTTFMRPITTGTVHAEGRPRHTGRTTWVWDVEFSDDAGRLCATSRVTIAVRGPRGSPE